MKIITSQHSRNNWYAYWFASLMVAVSGCGKVPLFTIGHDVGIDKAIGELRAFRTEIVKQSDEWKKHLDKMQGQLRVDVEFAIDKISEEGLKDTICYSEFFESKVIKYLDAVEYALARKRLEYRLHGHKALEGTVDSIISEIVRSAAKVDPHICQSLSKVVVTYLNMHGEHPRFAASVLARESENFTGYGFRNSDEAKLFHIDVLDSRGLRRTLGTSKGQQPLITVGVGSTLNIRMELLGGRILEGDQMLYIMFGSSELCEVDLKFGDRPLPLPPKVPIAPWPSDPVSREYRTIEGQFVVEKNLGVSTYRFNEKVDSKSKVLIIAPNGTVDFSTAPSFLSEGSKVDGASIVMVIARSVTFQAKLDNDETRAYVILTSGGTSSTGLSFFDSFGHKTRAFWCTDGPLPGAFVPPKNQPSNLQERPLDEILNQIRKDAGEQISESEFQYLHWYLKERSR